MFNIILISFTKTKLVPLDNPPELPSMLWFTMCDCESTCESWILAYFRGEGGGSDARVGVGGFGNLFQERLICIYDTLLGKGF